MAHYTVELVGPEKQITSKKTGKQMTIYQVKFQEDPNWTDLFSDTAPTPGQTFEGTVEKGPYGYTFKKAGGFPMRAGGGYSNRQLALQSAVRISTTSPEAALAVAETFLKWLDHSPAPTMSQSASVPTQQHEEQPPIESYDLGLN